MLNGILLVGLIPLLSSSVFGVVPQLHGEYRRMQKLDFGNAALRLLLVGGLALSSINAWLAASVGALTNWIELKCNRRWASDHADPTAPQNEEDRRQIAQTSARCLPNALFFCFQGQITLLILTLAGNKIGIADVTALGRLSAILTVVAVAINTVLPPRFARCQEQSRLWRLYLLVCGTSALIFLLPLLLSLAFPSPLLWLLGRQYQSLEAELALAVAVTCITQFGGVMWNLNIAKGWIGVITTAHIPAVILVQVATVACLNLTTVRNVLIFSLLSALVPPILYAIDAIRGLTRPVQVLP
jgi:O-antigen/teichoic acid export membrane protein